MTFFATRPKSSLVLDVNDPQSLVNLIAMDISYKKPCQYGRRTLSVTDCNDQKKKGRTGAHMVEYMGKIVKKHPHCLKQPGTQFFVLGFGIGQVN